MTTFVKVWDRVNQADLAFDADLASITKGSFRQSIVSDLLEPEYYPQGQDTSMWGDDGHEGSMLEQED